MADDLDQLTKDELLDVADQSGVEVKSTDKKADIIAAIRASEGGEPEAQKPPEPVVITINPNQEVNNFNARSDDDAYLGSFVDVVGGEHQGVYGSYVQSVEWDTTGDGYPTKALVRSRDANNELLVVDYADLRNSDRVGGR